ncbi:hypothetical protein SDC9_133494 [bioreactor metagenome]|uniref:Uncharacterized protein n=1 Tax=bioreactor metagenome TaxID=1076179 RepID=A0A645DAY5_9ZZZZ
MQSVKSKISRSKIYKGIFEPCETVKSEKILEDSHVRFYDEAAKLLTQIYMIKKGDEGCA